MWTWNQTVNVLLCLTDGCKGSCWWFTRSSWLWRTSCCWPSPATRGSPCLSPRLTSCSPHSVPSLALPSWTSCVRSSELSTSTCMCLAWSSPSRSIASVCYASHSASVARSAPSPSTCVSRTWPSSGACLARNTSSTLSTRSWGHLSLFNRFFHSISTKTILFHFFTYPSSRCGLLLITMVDFVLILVVVKYKKRLILCCYLET